MPYEFIESNSFSKYVYDYMDDETYADFQLYLIANPNVGDVIPKGGGLRKVRWPGKGKGKRGGLRIVYFNRLNKGQIYLMAICAKNEAENFTDDEIKLMRKEGPND